MPPLLPLHISLQAFFGISRDEQGKWVELIKALPNEWSDGFPTKDAFLLVPEAEWDFYASIFNRVMPPCGFAHGMDEKYDNNSCEEEKEEYKKDKNLAILLENAKRDEVLRGTYEGLKSAYGKENNSFVKILREICAILANTQEETNECDKGERYYGYKGKKGAQKKRDEVLDRLGKGLETNFREKHCKLERNKNNPLCEILVKQIEEWGVRNSRKVIEGIDAMAKSLGY